MTPRSLLAALLGAGLACAGAAPVQAGAQKEVEAVGDWKIVRDTGSNGETSCLAARTYKDEGDDNATWVVFGQEPDQVVLVLGYGGWSFETEAKRTVVMLVGDRIVDLRSHWSAKDKQFVGSFPATLQPTLLASDRIVLRFKDGDVTFKIAGLPAAIEGIKRCAAPPPPPSQARLQAYLAGRLFEISFDRCDVPTTSRQRADLSAKLAALKSEMRGVEDEVAQAVREIDVPSHCPKGPELAGFTRKVDTYLSATPEAFAAQLERDEAEKEAQKAAAEKRAADEKAAAERLAAERSAAEKSAAERAAAEKALADRKAADAKAAETAAPEAKAAAKAGEESPATTAATGDDPAGGGAKADGAKDSGAKGGGAKGGKPGAGRPAEAGAADEAPAPASKPNAPDPAPAETAAPKP